ATGTPGDLNELSLVEGFIGDKTRITARKGQLGHGMANSGGWELTTLALSLQQKAIYPTGIGPTELHPNIPRRDPIAGDMTPIAGDGSRVGFSVILGIGGITSCVVMRSA